MYYVYIIRCADGAFYIGHTSDLTSRIARHNEASACRFTPAPGRRPVVRVYSEPHPTRASAATRERQLKRWTRAKKEALVAGDSALLRRL
jgi:predicted GIY-YIG superfamily endonuclease